MSIDIDLIDKSNFVCFQLKDESVYFGEILYQDEEGRLHDQKQDPEAPNKGKPVRHGFGIQLFGTNPDNFLCKYEGYWENDKQTGQCRMWFPDKAIYEGYVKNGIKEGFGKFSWPSGDVYEGNWRNNRFEGGGTFSHHDGSVCKGLFKNNYYVQQGEIFINPFLSEEEQEEFLRRRHEISQIKEKNKKQKLFFFQKTNNYNELSDLIKQSNQNGRIPIIFSSKQNDSKLDEVKVDLKSITKKNYYDFDLRKIYFKKETDKSHLDYLNCVKQDLSNVLIKGEGFFINLDESDVQYEEIFYPDIREFYRPSCFPTQIWELEELKRYQIFEKIIGNTDNQFAHDVNPDFNIMVWSKYKINEELENKIIIEKIERRFSTILPLIKLDFILITQPQQQSQNNHEQIPEEDEQQQQE